MPLEDIAEGEKSLALIEDEINSIKDQIAGLQRRLVKALAKRDKVVSGEK